MIFKRASLHCSLYMLWGTSISCFGFFMATFCRRNFWKLLVELDIEAWVSLWIFCLGNSEWGFNSGTTGLALPAGMTLWIALCPLKWFDSLELSWWMAVCRYFVCRFLRGEFIDGEGWTGGRGSAIFSRCQCKMNEYTRSRVLKFWATTNANNGCRAASSRLWSWCVGSPFYAASEDGHIYAKILVRHVWKYGISLQFLFFVLIWLVQELGRCHEIMSDEIYMPCHKSRLWVRCYLTFSGDSIFRYVGWILFD